MAERETGAQMVHVPVPRIVIQRRKWKAEEIRTLLQNNPRQESESALTWVNRLKELFGPGQMYTQKDWGDNVKDIKAAAAKSIESEQGQTQVQGGAWRSEAGDLVSEDTYNDSATDLNTLLNALSRDLHTVGPRTLIGGYAVKAKNAPKVETVNASARIDAQAPISGAYNIQFQIGDDSLANVVFTDADKEPQIKRYLRRSLREGQKYLSPSFTG
ncbi:MAG: hypothetical protein JOZ41_22195 [Chloroflexi bacterium]|nr:hypothetical protein [Chloroflexota bacterium]